MDLGGGGIWWAWRQGRLGDGRVSAETCVEAGDACREGRCWACIRPHSRRMLTFAYTGAFCLWLTGLLECLRTRTGRWTTVDGQTDGRAPSRHVGSVEVPSTTIIYLSNPPRSSGSGGAPRLVVAPGAPCHHPPSIPSASKHPPLPPCLGRTRRRHGVLRCPSCRSSGAGANSLRSMCHSANQMRPVHTSVG